MDRIGMGIVTIGIGIGIAATELSGEFTRPVPIPYIHP